LGEENIYSAMATCSLKMRSLSGCLLALLCLFWGSPAQAEPLSPALGMHVAQGDAAHLQAAQAAGASFVVVVFSWRDIEPVPNFLYWEVPDAAMRAARFAGLQVVARLDRPPDWALDPHSPAPWSLDAYAAFVRHVTQRYADELAGVIVWNEPNLALEWNGSPPDPAGYTAMLAAAYAAVKSVAPTLPVAAAGLAFTLDNGLDAVNDLDFLEALYAAGAAAFFDVLATHPYGFGRPPEDPPAPDQLNFRRMELQRARMVAHGDAAKPVWITEMGWRTAAPNPADRWQVVSPARQRTYTLAALEQGATYPWLQRMALWELNRTADLYGYAFWQGPDRASLAYKALVARHRQPPPSPQTPHPIPITAPDVVVRLGDRGELHPHWVHLYRGGEHFSPEWQGEFFVDASQSLLTQTLVLETLQVDQPTNTVWVNDHPIGTLHPRSRPDPTSTWVTQQMTLPAGVLQSGLNHLRIVSGSRNPARSWRWWRFENFQFRHARLAPPLPPATGSRWRPLPASPPGWSEAVRLRPAADGTGVWLTTNRRGQLWYGRFDEAGQLTLTAQEAGRTDLLFLDVADDGIRQVAATDAGLFWRQGNSWLPTAGTPARPASLAWHRETLWYAAFAADGLWQAPHPAGPWSPTGLQGRTVFDLAADGPTLFAATDAGLFQFSEPRGWHPLAPLPARTRTPDDDNYVTRLWIGNDGTLVARSEGSLWRWAQEQASWLPFGPPDLPGKLEVLIGCCDAGTLAGAHQNGLWQLSANGTWTRVDGSLFDFLEFGAGVRLGPWLLVATTNGLFTAATDAPLDTAWRAAKGTPSTVTDLQIDPADPRHWLAATPVGLWRSTDAGSSWQPASPPWIVWDLALDPRGRLYLAHAAGLAWTDDIQHGPPRWQQTQGLKGVTFFTVSPNPADPTQLWAGSWGNDIGVSQDGGTTVARLGAGLETLSILSLLRHPTPGQYTVGTIEGLYRSDDHGASWFKLPGALRHQTLYALQQDEKGVLWAGSTDGLWQSTDYGVTWESVLSTATVIHLGQKGSLLWAGSEEAGLWWSQNHGASWSHAGLAGRTVYTVATDGLQWIAATDAGLYTLDSPPPPSTSHSQ
jgi:hypothetical protein